MQPDSVLYEAFGGRGVLCSPEALFRAAYARRDLSHLTHVWAIDRASLNADSVRALAELPRVRVVTRGSREYWKTLSTAGTLVNNATFLPGFGKRPGQVYLNTWHGTPLKHMGFDMPNGASESANVLRNFLSADFLLSQNRFMTERMYLDGYRLRGILPGRIVELGYPRTDLQYNDALVRRLTNQLTNDGYDIERRRTVVYAPTWRGETFGSPRNNAEELVETVRRMQSTLGDDVRVLLKPHPSVAAFARELTSATGLVLPDEVPTNVVLGLADVLVTDFSSIFFDYLSLDRPIVFYAPDSADYDAARGMYWSTTDLPGEHTMTESDTTDAIRRALDGTEPAALRTRRREWGERFTADDDGQSAERVVDLVFNANKRRSPRSPRSSGSPERELTADSARTGTIVTRSEDVVLPGSDRERLVIYPGGMRPNGITASILNLLSRLDYDRYDVTVICAKPQSRAQARTQALIDSRARVLVRVGGMNGSKFSHLLRRGMQRPGLIRVAQSMSSQQRLWRDEVERCFGDARFDRAIDFSGYAQFWAQLILAVPATTRSIWLHNDLGAEALRPINGATPMKRSLGAVAQLYRDFSSLVSVSPALSTINERSFRRIAPHARFVSARNVMSVSPPDAAAADENAPWLARMSEPGTYWFITVGRYSAEKNQERLIRAFATVHAERPQARLVLVGYGPLAKHLAAVVTELGLDDVVCLTGAVSTPLQLMEAADAFVLSSDWEGQPMVLLEAASIGMPIISVAFGSVASALPGDGLHVVERTVPALADGLRAALDGRVSTDQLDIDRYNGEALGEFAAAVSPGHPADTRA